MLHSDWEEPDENFYNQNLVELDKERQCIEKDHLSAVREESEIQDKFENMKIINKCEKNEMSVIINNCSFSWTIQKCLSYNYWMQKQ